MRRASKRACRYIFADNMPERLIDWTAATLEEVADGTLFESADGQTIIGADPDMSWADLETMPSAVWTGKAVTAFGQTVYVIE